MGMILGTAADMARSRPRASLSTGARISAQRRSLSSPQKDLWLHWMIPEPGH
jgi:hypothetical protein